MAYTPAVAAAPHVDYPVRTIGVEDLNAALREGYDDFKAKRGDLIFIGALYPAIGLLAAVAANGGQLLPFLFPMMAGLSLLGPLLSTGFYELAKRREAGLESSWWHFLDIRKSASRDEIAVVAVILICVAGAWVFAAGLLYALFFGTTPETMVNFLRDVLMTPQGWAMILVGNLIGLSTQFFLSGVALACGLLALQQMRADDTCFV